MNAQTIFYVFAIFVLTYFIIVITAGVILIIRMKKKVKKFVTGNGLTKIMEEVLKQKGMTSPVYMPNMPIPGPIRIDPEEEKLNWYIENAPLGKFLGYPECCIKEFCEQPPHILEGMEVSQSDKDRYKASFLNDEYTGFIPCKKHTEEILQGKITLESLIQNRDKNIPAFPNF